MNIWHYFHTHQSAGTAIYSDISMILHGLLTFSKTFIPLCNSEAQYSFHSVLCCCLVFPTVGSLHLFSLHFAIKEYMNKPSHPHLTLQACLIPFKLNFPSHLFTSFCLLPMRNILPVSSTETQSEALQHAFILFSVQLLSH